MFPFFPLKFHVKLVSGSFDFKTTKGTKKKPNFFNFLDNFVFYYNLQRVEEKKESSKGIVEEESRKGNVQVNFQHFTYSDDLITDFEIILNPENLLCTKNVKFENLKI
ncbi:hypothetical protein BpHYR1_046851 [Brachionus plicatilis]|uniref:Uncharacterized protein n=1 Tax=Brachionus plicatilis TaxID=10195 RepID=A0A3M7T8E0_BRAPC|nr:hypothetical protein BpHYR1_046851 [Brachionus plicatilis]